MRVTKTMLKNGYTGPGELDDTVAEFRDGNKHGLGIDNTVAGEYKDNKLHGYAVSKLTGNINYYTEGKITEQLVTQYPNGNVWIGDGNEGIFVMLDGTVSHAKPEYIMNPVLVLTSNMEYKRMGMVELKNLQIDFTGWYCPIYKSIINISPVGEIQSGVCGNIRHNNWKIEPWQKLDKLEFKTPDTCGIGTCFCDADILQAKGINKEAYDLLYNKKDMEPWQIDSLPVVTDEDTIIGIDRFGKARMSEVHFHIGRRCNYDCTYCPGPEQTDGGIHDNFSPHLTLDEFKHCLKLLHPHLPTEPHRRLYITGGEPTINPMLPEFVKHAISDGYEVRISTNGTAGERRYTELLNMGAMLEVSLHVEFTIDKVLNRLAKLVPLWSNEMITVKCMSYDDTEFAQKVQAIIPKDKDIYYYPIYGRDIEHKYYYTRTEEEKETAEIQFDD
jgi:organic radical activating enzyme